MSRWPGTRVDASVTVPSAAGRSSRAPSGRCMGPLTGLRISRASRSGQRALLAALARLDLGEEGPRLRSELAGRIHLQDLLERGDRLVGLLEIRVVDHREVDQALEVGRRDLLRLLEVRDRLVELAEGPVHDPLVREDVGVVGLE